MPVPGTLGIEAGSKVQLIVKCEDEAEVFVIDGRFQMVARGVGRETTFDLAPGIYKVKVRVANEIREEHVVLRPEDKTVEKAFPKFEFASPVPLADTSQSHEYQMGAASDTSHAVHLTAGQGSLVFVFARDWTPGADARAKRGARLNPARGLELLRADGTVVADFETAGVHSPDKDPDPWAGCNVQLDPGLYRLRLTIPDMGTIEQTIVASPGWQTQIFLLQKAYGSDPEARRADLSGASILLARDRGFSPGDDNRPYEERMRLVELARQGLVNQRRVLPPSVEQEILYGKFENPMLGIYGAHLLLLKSDPDMQIYHQVIGNLRRLLGDGHPDVEALALAEPDSRSTYIYSAPPMLRRSWQMVLNASVTRPGLVPLGSLASQIAPRIWGDEPWLMWMSPAAGVGAPTLGTLGASSDVVPPGLEDALQLQLQEFQQSAPVKSPPTRGPGVLGIDTGTKSLDTSQLTEAQMQRLVASLGVPRANVEQLLAQRKT